MKDYKDKKGDSEIAGYELLDFGIKLRFKNGVDRDFSNQEVDGFFKIDKLRALAEAGEGLDAFVAELDEETKKVS